MSYDVIDRIRLEFIAKASLLVRVYGVMNWLSLIVAYQAKTDEMEQCAKLLEALDMQPTNYKHKLAKFGAFT